MQHPLHIPNQFLFFSSYFYLQISQGRPVLPTSNGPFSQIVLASQYKVPFACQKQKLTPFPMSPCCNLFSSSCFCGEGHSGFCRMCYLFPTNPPKTLNSPNSLQNIHSGQSNYSSACISTQTSNPFS